MASPVSGLPGEDDPLYRIGVMLINGYGYNWYRLDNQMRADDLLVRSRVSEHLAGAVARLRDLEGRYRRKFLPPPTREHPDPDPVHLAAARQFRAIEDRIGDIDTRVRGAAVPPNDRIWQRHRDELDTLAKLGNCDVLMLGGAKQLADLVAMLPVDLAIAPESEQRIDTQLAQLAGVLSRRGDILAIF
ncbi:MAG TPA: hypothetical protein VNV38_12435 [Stellaceae bacterium]|nr:hypothetical protein [Stellaceae bacterium]